MCVCEVFYMEPADWLWGQLGVAEEPGFSQLPPIIVLFSNERLSFHLFVMNSRCCFLVGVYGKTLYLVYIIIKRDTSL